VDQSAIPQFSARALHDAFQRLLGTMKLLLLKITQGLFIRLQLLLLGRGVGVLRYGFALSRGL
jgi:hypothetical protein